jgi:hypothetical protein
MVFERAVESTETSRTTRAIVPEFPPGRSIVLSRQTAQIRHSEFVTLWSTFFVALLTNILVKVVGLLLLYFALLSDALVSQRFSGFFFAMASETLSPDRFTPLTERTLWIWKKAPRSLTSLVS